MMQQRGVTKEHFPTMNERDNAAKRIGTTFNRMSDERWGQCTLEMGGRRAGPCAPDARRSRAQPAIGDAGDAGGDGPVNGLPADAIGSAVTGAGASGTFYKIALASVMPP